MATQPYYSVRTSKIHGRGVFARRPIRKGTRVIEYTGPIISTKEADKIGEKTENGHSHTMLFTVDENRVINGNEGGDARYINHSCSPNCEAIQDGDRIFIESLRSIKKGEEITYDYYLQVEGKITDKVKKEYACFCGSPNCRGTQIAPEILEAQVKRDIKKAAKKEKERLAKELKKAEAKARKELKKKAKADAKAEKKKAKAEKKAKKKKAKAEAKKLKAKAKAEAKAKKKKAKAEAENKVKAIPGEKKSNKKSGKKVKSKKQGKK